MQGEIFWQHDKHIQKQHGSNNYRSMVAGALMAKKASSDKLKNLNFWVWEWANGPISMTERLQGLQQMGFVYGVNDTRPVKDFAQIEQQRIAIFETALDYPTDGIIIRQGKRPPAEYWQNKEPSWAIAWKFPVEQQVTTITNIYFTVGRTGKISAIAEIEPTMIDGRKIAKVSLGSANSLQQLDLNIGDNVILSLSGQSIPQIKQVIWRTEQRQSYNTPNMTTFTPYSCFSYSVECEPQFLARLEWLSSKQGLNLKQISKGTWRNLLKANQLNHIASWLTLSEQELLTIDGISKKQAQHIYQQFQLAKTRSSYQWLIVLGFTGLPEQIAQYSLAELILWSPNDWQQLKGISKHKAKYYSQLIQVNEIKWLAGYLENNDR